MNRTRVLAIAAVVVVVAAVAAALLLRDDQGDDAAAPTTTADTRQTRAAASPRARLSGTRRGAAAEQALLAEFIELSAGALEEGVQIPANDDDAEGGALRLGTPRTLGRESRTSQPSRSGERSSRVNAARVLAWQGWPSPRISQVGKIVSIKANGVQSACSGTIVGRRLMLTAAHCLFDAGAGGFHSRIVFAPAMTWQNAADPDSISVPYGVWEASRWWIPEGYRQGRPEYDWGLAEIAPLNGRNIGDVVGMWPVQANVRWGAGARVYSVGYPASGFWAEPRGYHGRGQYACDTRWDAGEWNREASGVAVIHIDCTMNGGASGGPWLVRLNTGKWVIGGVNDWCFGPNMDDPQRYCTPWSYQIKSAAFDNSFLAFWNSVQPNLTVR